MKNEAGNKEEISLDIKAIGADERDFESVLVDGCLGFSLSVGNAVLFVVMAMLQVGDVLHCGIVSVFVAAVAIVLLRVGLLLTDTLQQSLGRRIILITHIAAYVGAAVFMIAGLHYVSVAFAAAGVVSTTFLYGRYLAALIRKALMLLVDALFAYAGVMVLVVSQLEPPIAQVALSSASFISLVTSYIFTTRNYRYDDFVSAADSKDRSIKVKGNNHTLFLLGFMFAIGFLALFVDVRTEYAIMALGAAVGTAGVVSLLTRQIDERWYKESLKKSAAFVAALLLLPIPLVPDMVKLVLLSVYMCLVSLNVIVLLNAMVETTRFNMISPIWLFGQEGSVFFLGMLLGNVLLVAGFVAMQWVDPGGAQYAVLVLAVVLCSWMQIRVNYQVYPFEPVIEEKEDDETAAYIEQEGRRKLVWHNKIEAACEQYKLSPREREVLRLLLKGRDAKYIMDTFYISQSTAKTHIYNVYRKFGIHSRQELIDFVEDIEVPADDAEGTQTS